MMCECTVVYTNNTNKSPVNLWYPTSLIAPQSATLPRSIHWSLSSFPPLFLAANWSPGLSQLPSANSSPGHLVCCLASPRTCRGTTHGGQRNQGCTCRTCSGRVSWSCLCGPLLPQIYKAWCTNLPPKITSSLLLPPRTFTFWFASRLHSPGQLQSSWAEVAYPPTWQWKGPICNYNQIICRWSAKFKGRAPVAMFDDTGGYPNPFSLNWTIIFVPISQAQLLSFDPHSEGAWYTNPQILRHHSATEVPTLHSKEKVFKKKSNWKSDIVGCIPIIDSYHQFPN